MSSKVGKLNSSQDWVFSVVLSVGLGVTSSNSRNKDTAKPDCFCDLHAFFKWGGTNNSLFLRQGASFKKGWEPVAYRGTCQTTVVVRAD